MVKIYFFFFLKNNYEFLMGYHSRLMLSVINIDRGFIDSLLESTYKPHYHYQNCSPLANGPDLNREKHAILQTHWH